MKVFQAGFQGAQMAYSWVCKMNEHFTKLQSFFVFFCLYLLGTLDCIGYFLKKMNLAFKVDLASDIVCHVKCIHAK